MDYRIIRSSRKTISIQISPRGEILVRCPNRMKKADIEAFVRSKQTWIDNHLPKPGTEPVITEEQLRSLTNRAKEVLAERTAFFAPMVGVSYGRITIRCQRTRWGSCTREGNLNYNCLLMLTPAEVVDYVVVHELCHRKEMNHSSRFWAEVAQILPNYAEPRAWLKENGNALIARLP